MIREIKVTVSADGSIIPDVPQYGGIQGEHNMCRVVFDITEWAGEHFTYRGEFVDGYGCGWSTDLLTPESAGGSTVVGYLFPDAWTVAGGKGIARLVASKIVDNHEIERAYVVDVRVYFKSKQEVDPQAGNDQFAGMSALLSEIHETIKDAETATSDANTATGQASVAAEYSTTNGTYAKNQGDYAKAQGDYAKGQGDAAKSAAIDATAAAGLANEKAGYAQEQSSFAMQQGQYANAKAAEAVLAANRATTAAGDADTASIAANNAASAANSAALIASDAAEAAEQATAVIADTLARKAEVDGAYDELTAGNAKQLVSTVFTVDRTPYLFRTSGGSIDIGDRENDTIIGGTVCWNQLFLTNNTRSSGHGVSYTKVDNGSFTLDGTEADQTWYYRHTNIPKTITGHVYYLDKGADGNFEIYNDGKGVMVRETERMAVCKASGVDDFILRIPFGGTYNNLTVKPQILNLTKMFGSTIADYVYSLEQANTGTGVAWFKRLFPKDCYAYNAGELMSVIASAHKMVGFNAYNYATGQAKLVGGHPYQITGSYTALSFETETVTPDADGYFTPSKDGVLSVADGNATDTCVHLVWDGERDGEYAPYEEHIYPLDDSLTLRGELKLDGNNGLYYDGDVYENNRIVTRRRGVRVYQNGDENDPNVITDGTNTEYWLTTTTTETANTFTDPQIVDDFGTEEYVDERTVPIPVGHTTKYQNNLRAKLEMAPNSPSGDGDYVVRQVNGINTYALLEIPEELPDAPTADGTYTLKVMVSDGVVQCIWKLDENGD